MATISRFSDIAQMYSQTQFSGSRNADQVNKPNGSLTSLPTSTGADTVSISDRAFLLFNSEVSSPLDAGGSQLPPLKSNEPEPTEGQNTPSDAGGSQLPPLKPRDKN